MVATAVGGGTFWAAAAVIFAIGLAMMGAQAWILQRAARIESKIDRATREARRARRMAKGTRRTARQALATASRAEAAVQSHTHPPLQPHETPPS